MPRAGLAPNKPKFLSWLSDLWTQLPMHPLMLTSKYMELFPFSLETGPFPAHFGTCSHVFLFICLEYSYPCLAELVPFVLQVLV
jgi:hypothetical protein